MIQQCIIVHTQLYLLKTYYNTASNTCQKGRPSLKWVPEKRSWESEDCQHDIEHIICKVPIDWYIKKNTVANTISCQYG